MKSENLMIGLALVSSFFVMLAMGSFYTFGALTPYLASFLHYHDDESMTTTKISPLLPAQLLCLTFGMITASHLTNKISNKLICIISLVCMSASVFVTSFFSQLWAYILVYGFVYGFSIGFGYLCALKNLYSYLPNRKGLCGGFCFMAFGLSSVIFNQILQRLINPDNAKATDGYFPLDIADNVPYALKIMSAVYFGCSVIGIATFIPKKTLKVIERDGSEPDSMIGSENYVVSATDTLLSIQPPKITLKYFFSKKMHLLMLTIFCTIPFGFFVAFSYKEYGMVNINDDQFLTTVGSIGSLSNGFCRFFWGALFDRFSFAIILGSMNAILLACCIAIYFVSNANILYLLVIVITFFCYGGTYGIFPTQTVRILGEKAGTKIYPYIFFGFSLGGLFEFIMHYVLVVDLGKEGFLYCFIIFGVMQVIGLILSVTIKYDYDESEKIYAKNK